MSALVAQLLTFQRQLAIELQRFWLLWRYQYRVPPYTLWWRLVLKRIFDVAAVLIGVVIIAPILALVALAVKCTSPGPILYRQQRVGCFGDLFNIYKFRTMVVDAEAAGPVWAAGARDPRATPIGSFLRETHLDELPQLFNILKGDMSLVGPRPERPHFVERLDREIPRYDERLLIKPGLTGLAQVHVRSDQSIADVKKKLRFDRLYIKRMCLALDAKILVWTALMVLTGREVRTE